MRACAQFVAFSAYCRNIIVRKSSGFFFTMVSCRNFASTINNYYKSKENEKAIYFVVGTEKVIPVFPSLLSNQL